MAKRKDILGWKVWGFEDNGWAVEAQGNLNGDPWGPTGLSLLSVMMGVDLRTAERTEDGGETAGTAMEGNWSVWLGDLATDANFETEGEAGMAAGDAADAYGTAEMQASGMPMLLPSETEGDAADTGGELGADMSMDGGFAGDMGGFEGGMEGGGDGGAGGGE
jgi:hypothetical protein